MSFCAPAGTRLVANTRLVALMQPETPSSSRVGAATGRKTAKNGSNGHEIEPATSSDADTSPLSAAARRVVEKQMAKLAEELAELQETSPQAEAQIEELKEKLRVIRGEVMEAVTTRVRRRGARALPPPWSRLTRSRPAVCPRRSWWPCRTRSARPWRAR